MNAKVSPALPTDALEARAAEQRRRLHDSMLELREHVEDKLDVKKQARENIWPASGIATLVGVLFGWGFASLFSAPHR
jgi:hypothetical protein